MGDFVLGGFGPMGDLVLGDYIRWDFILGDFILGDLVRERSQKYEDNSANNSDRRSRVNVFRACQEGRTRYET